MKHELQRRAKEETVSKVLLVLNQLVEIRKKTLIIVKESNYKTKLSLKILLNQFLQEEVKFSENLQEDKTWTFKEIN